MCKKAEKTLKNYKKTIKFSKIANFMVKGDKMSKTKISIEEVKRLAGLSALEFSEEELSAFIPEFEAMLELVDEVKNCDTGEAQLNYTTHLLSECREDEAKESFPQEEILLNSPKTKKGSFCVPKMLD